MPITFTPQDVNIDETAGSQPNEITLTQFQASPYAYLLGLTSGSAGEDGNFPQVAYNPTFLTSVVSGGTTVADLVFTHPTSSTNSTLIPFSATTGFQTTLQDVDGNTIYLFLDSTEASNGNVLIGRTADSPTASSAFAIVLDEATNHQSAGAYVVLYEAMKHLNPAEINDILHLTNQLYVSAATSTTSTALFSDFSDVPSGNTDFAIIGPDAGQTSTANLLVTGDAPKGNVNSPTQNSTVNVSTQGLGSGSQAVGKNATLQIDFINGGATNTTGSADQIAYTSHVENVTETQFSLTQVNPSGELINLTVAAGNEQGDLKGAGFRNAVGSNVDITQVQVFDAAGVLIEDSDSTPNATGTNAVTATIVGGDAVITNLQVDYTVKVFSAGMDQIRITNTDPNNNASFDVGEIQFSSTTTTVGSDNVEVGSKVNIVDDAPSIQVAGALPLMQVDETNFLMDDTEALSGLFTISGGSDTATSNLTLVATAGVATGLVATGTNTAITLVQSSPTLVQGVDGSGNVIFDVSITSGVLKLDQKLAIKHPTTDPNESISIASGLADLLKVQGTVTDKDGDPSGPVSISIADKLAFLDDGPSIDQAITGGTVAYASGRTVTDTFSSATGNDLGDGTKIGSYTDLAGYTENLSEDGKTLNYNNDTTKVNDFTLTVNDGTAASLTDSAYTFTVNSTQQNVAKALDFGSVKAGGPQETLAVSTVGPNPSVVNFDGLLITDDSDPRLAVNNPGATTDRDDLNPDSLGFGIKGGQASQMNNDEGFVAQLAGGGELSAFSFGMQAIGNVKSVNVTYWTVEDGKLSAPVTTTETLLGGQGITPYTINTPQGVDQIYVEFEYLGKNGNPDLNAGVRLLNFTETEQQVFNPVNLSFNLTNTDKDGDKVTSNTYSILVDPAIA